MIRRLMILAAASGLAACESERRAAVDPALATLGAAYYAQSCAQCHGSELMAGPGQHDLRGPAVNVRTFSDRMKAGHRGLVLPGVTLDQRSIEALHVYVTVKSAQP